MNKTKIKELLNTVYQSNPKYHLKFYIDYSLINQQLADQFNLHEEQFENIFYYTFNAIETHLINKLNLDHIIKRKDNLIDIEYFFNDKESYMAVVDAYKDIENNLEQLLWERRHLLTYGGNEGDFKLSMQWAVQYNIDELLKNKTAIQKSSTVVPVIYMEELSQEEKQELKNFKLEQYAKKKIL